MARFWKIAVTALIAAGFASACSCSAAQFRGAWVTAWTPGIFTPEQVDATIAAAKSAGLNALFIQVRKNADAYYKSDLEPRGADLSPDFDPLAYAIEKAHQQGIEIHAWMNTYRVWTAKEHPADPTHIVNCHPTWLIKNSDGGTRSGDGLYLDPGIPEVREHIAAVALDIVKRYDVDGLHLDYIRYPGVKWGYSDIALRRYRADTGARGTPKPDDPKWLDWRRDQVTELVRMISTQVRAVKPKIKITAATIPWGDCPADYCESSPYSVVCQDWRGWLAEGLLDANVPMNYKSEKSAKTAQHFRNWLQGFKRWGNGKQVYVGIDVYVNDVAGVKRQMAAIDKAGLDGYVWFSLNSSRRRAELVEAMGGGSAAADSAGPPGRAEFDKAIRYAVANQLGLAKVYLKKAIELDPEFAEAYFRLGRCYLRERNTAQAQTFFEKTLRIDPSHEGAKRELEVLSR